jgi:DegV family protein with EDD domain
VPPIKIVTDTTCDLPSAWLEQDDITVVPFNIQFGLETFREGIDITPEAFYERIQTEQTLPTTSQPAVGEFCQLYETLGAGDSHILSIHLTSKLSGAWQAAVLAAKQLPDTIQVGVVDSWTGSVGLGLMVREAARLIRAGLTLEELVSHLESRRRQVNVFIMLKDLRYARMSGRVGALRETLASLLHVKPIIGVNEGALVPLDRVRGHKKGLDRMLELAEAAVGDKPIHLGMTHALAPAEAETLLAQAKARLNCQETFMTELALSLAVHFGPGTIGFATYPAE